MMNPARAPTQQHSWRVLFAAAASWAVLLACIAPKAAGFQQQQPFLVRGQPQALTFRSSSSVRSWHSGSRRTSSLPTLKSALNPAPSEQAWRENSSLKSWARRILMKNGGRAPLHRNALPTDDVRMWRSAAGIALSMVMIFRRTIDHHLAVLWNHLMTGSSIVARIFRTDSYEWCLAVVAFVVWMHAFYFADVAVDAAAQRGRIHPWRKYRLQDRFEADKKRRTQLAAAATNGQASSVTPHTRGGDNAAPSDEKIVPQLSDVFRTKQSDWNRQAWFFELWVYVLPLLTWDLLAPRRHRRLAPFGAPTTLRIMGDVTLGLLLYDFLFFCGHCLMHKVPWIFRTIHAKHHGVKEVRAGDTVRLSLVEEVLEVGFSIIALNLLGIHPLARTLYNCVITFLLTELHSGFDFPWSPQNVVPFGLATGSRRHHYHHRNGRHYYQKFFFTFDRLFGLYQKDDGTIDGDSVRPDPYIPPSWQAA